MATSEIELRIELNQSPLFLISPNLGGVVYNLKFIWSYRWIAWYMNVGDAVKGIKLVNGIDLLGSYHYLSGVPAGKLGVARNKGRTSKPFFDNLGIEKEMTLIYEDP